MRLEETRGIKETLLIGRTTCQQGRGQASTDRDSGPAKAGRILESKPISSMTIPPLLVRLVWMCLSNVFGRQTQSFKCFLPFIYIFLLKNIDLAANATWLPWLSAHKPWIPILMSNVMNWKRAYHTRVNYVAYQRVSTYGTNSKCMFSVNNQLKSPPRPVWALIGRRLLRPCSATLSLPSSFSRCRRLGSPLS